MKYFETISVIAVEAVIRTDPEEAVVILADADDGIIGETLLYSEIPHRQFSCGGGWDQIEQA
jgi:hypothetical protein